MVLVCGLMEIVRFDFVDDGICFRIVEKGFKLVMFCERYLRFLCVILERFGVGRVGRRSSDGW